MAAPATSGTNTAIWTNFLIAAATAIVGIIDPSMLAAVLGPKLALFAPGIVAGINWLLHSFTGNSATALLPGTPLPTVNPGNPNISTGA